MTTADKGLTQSTLKENRIMTIITKTSKINNQFDVNLFTKEDAGSFIYKVVYGNETLSYKDDLLSALEEFENCCDHQLECSLV